MSQLRAPESIICVMPFRSAVCSTSFWRDSLVIFCKDTSEAQKISLQPAGQGGVRGALLACFPGSDFTTCGRQSSKCQEQPSRKGRVSGWRMALISSSAPNISGNYQERHRTSSPALRSGTRSLVRKKPNQPWTSVSQNTMESKLLSSWQEGL